MKKVYLLFLNNGEMYEDKYEICIGAFLEKEKVNTLSNKINEWLKERPGFNYNIGEFSFVPPSSIAFLGFQNHLGVIQENSYTEIQEIELYE